MALTDLYNHRIKVNGTAAGTFETAARAKFQALRKHKAGYADIVIEHRPDGQWLPDVKTQALFQTERAKVTVEKKAPAAKPATPSTLDSAVKNLSQVTRLLAARHSPYHPHESAALRDAIKAVSDLLNAAPTPLPRPEQQK